MAYLPIGLLWVQGFKHLGLESKGVGFRDVRFWSEGSRLLGYRDLGLRGLSRKVLGPH